MKRRSLITSGAVGAVVGLTGCLGGLTDTTAEGTSGDDEAGDAPEFDVDEEASGEFILLRNQPQEPDEIRVGDDVEIAAVLGNAGGDEVHGDVSFRFESPDGEASTETLNVPDSEPLPSGAARFYRVGPFTVDEPGDWSFTAAEGVADVHPSYSDTVTVHPHEE